MQRYILMSLNRIATGRDGEHIASDYLKKNGYFIIERNFKNYLGEIDIVAKENDVICFVEVRARREPADITDILDSIGKNKQYRLSRLALSYLNEKKLTDCRARFDVICIRFLEDKNEIALFKDAFEVCQKYS